MSEKTNSAEKTTAPLHDAERRAEKSADTSKTVQLQAVVGLLDQYRAPYAHQSSANPLVVGRYVGVPSNPYVCRCFFVDQALIFLSDREHPRYGVLNG